MKKNLSGLLAVCLLLATVFTSCKKENNNSSYIRFKLNGNWVTWDAVGELGPDLLDPTKTNFGVSAQSQPPNERIDLTFQVNGSSLNTGTYHSSQVYMPISYSRNMSSPNMEYFTLGVMPTGVESHYTIKLTEITSQKLTGTFTGNFLSSTSGGNTVNLTEGEFSVRRVR